MLASHFIEPVLRTKMPIFPRLPSNLYSSKITEITTTRIKQLTRLYRIALTYSRHFCEASVFSHFPVQFRQINISVIKLCWFVYRCTPIIHKLIQLSYKHVTLFFFLFAAGLWNTKAITMFAEISFIYAPVSCETNIAKIIKEDMFRFKQTWLHSLKDKCLGNTRSSGNKITELAISFEGYEWPLEETYELHEKQSHQRVENWKMLYSIPKSIIYHNNMYHNGIILFVWNAYFPDSFGIKNMATTS